MSNLISDEERKQIVLAMPCPRCKVTSSEPCRVKNVDYHSERWDAARPQYNELYAKREAVAREAERAALEEEERKREAKRIEEREKLVKMAADLVAQELAVVRFISQPLGVGLSPREVIIRVTEDGLYKVIGTRNMVALACGVMLDGAARRKLVEAGIDVVESGRREMFPVGPFDWMYTIDLRKT